MAIKKFFWRAFLWKGICFVPALIGIYISKKRQKMFFVMTDLVFHSHISPKVRINFFFRFHSLKLFICVRMSDLKHCCYRSVEPWYTRNGKNCYSLWKTSTFKLFFSSAIPASFFHQAVNRYLFTWKGIFQLNRLGDYGFEFFHQRLNWRC